MHEENSNGFDSGNEMTELSEHFSPCGAGCLLAMDHYLVDKHTRS